MSQIRNIYPALKKKPIRYEVEKSSNNDDTSQHISDSFLISFRFNREVLFMLLQPRYTSSFDGVLSRWRLVSLWRTLSTPTATTVPSTRPMMMSAIRDWPSLFWDQDDCAISFRVSFNRQNLNISSNKKCQTDKTNGEDYIGKGNYRYHFKRNFSDKFTTDRIV